MMIKIEPQATKPVPFTIPLLQACARGDNFKMQLHGRTKAPQQGEDINIDDLLAGCKPEDFHGEEELL